MEPTGATHCPGDRPALSNTQCTHPPKMHSTHCNTGVKYSWHARLQYGCPGCNAHERCWRQHVQVQRRSCGAATPTYTAAPVQNSLRGRAPQNRMLRAGLGSMAAMHAERLGFRFGAHRGGAQGGAHCRRRRRLCTGPSLACARLSTHTAYPPSIAYSSSASM